VKLQTLRARDLAGAGRLDSEYFWSPSRGAAERVAKLRAAGVRFEAVGDGVFGAHVWAPKRFKRIYAAQNEDRAGYLRPHDVFMYLPEPASWLSVERTRSLDHYSLSHGTILQTCSGRNLGPAVMVDSWLEQFVLSHDMVRIEVPNPRLRFFLLAYLRSPIGQELLRRDRTGSVIDHLTADHVAAQLVPIPGESAIDAAAKGMQRAFKKRDRARQALGELLAEFQSQLPKLKRRKKPAEGWTHRAANLVGRLDAAFYDPLVGRARRQIKRLGGVRVRDVAEVRMLGRYKRLYTDAANGRPIVSGTQLLQGQPVHLQYISPASFSDVTDFELRQGWLAYPSDGRADGSLGTPVVITPERDGWLASNMIARVIPRKGVDAGWLFLALRTPHAQVQFCATASGSVVDHTYPDDMNDVLLPEIECDGRAVLKAWRDLGAAQILEDEVIASLDEALSR